MRVTIHRSGGFGNIGAHAEVDTAELPKEKAAKIEKLVKALPPAPPKPLRMANAADTYQYDITVDGKRYTADDLSMPDQWRDLVDYLLED